MAALRGEGGELRWGYQLAGVMNFTVSQVPGPPSALIVHGRLSQSDPFAMRQCPLLFIWPMGARRWTYTVAALTVAGDQVTARLGPRQE